MKMVLKIWYSDNENCKKKNLEILVPHEKNFQTLALCEILSERPICERKLFWSKTASMYIMNISEFKII